MGYDPLSVTEEQFTAPSVLQELHPQSTPHIRIQLARDAGKLRIHTPSASAWQAVEETARRVGDITVLSRADKEVLAVALDLSRAGLSPRLVSDDYAVQNVAEALELPFVSLATRGIRYRFRWILSCPACKRRYAPDIKERVCDMCGTQLKRKVLRKNRVRHQSQ